MLDIQRRRTRGFFALLSLPATAMGFALSVQISALSWILATRYNLDVEAIGLIWAAGPIAGILGQVAVGLISDRVWVWNGRRRVFIIVGGITAALMLLALPEIGKAGPDQDENRAAQQPCAFGGQSLGTQRTDQG